MNHLEPHLIRSEPTHSK